MGTSIHGITSCETLTTFLGRTMRSGQESLCILAIFLSKFGCNGNAVGSLKILDSKFVFANPQNFTIHAKKFDFLLRTEIIAVLALSKFGCHGNCLASLEISDSIICGP